MDVELNGLPARAHRALRCVDRGTAQNNRMQSGIAMLVVTAAVAAAIMIVALVPQTLAVPCAAGPTRAISLNHDVIEDVLHTTVHGSVKC